MLEGLVFKLNTSPFLTSKQDVSELPVGRFLLTGVILE